MKNPSTENVEKFLEEIESLKAKASVLEKFETNQDNFKNNIIPSNLASFSWLENSPVCTKIVDVDFNLQYMSNSGVTKLKIDNIDDFYGKPYPLHFYSDSFKIPMNDGLIEAKATGKPITQEASILDADGNELWFNSTLIPINDAEGNLDYFLVVSSDITDRKQAEIDLIKSEEKLKEALEITHLGTFIFDDSTNLFETSAISDSILGIDKTYKRDIQGWINLVHPEDYGNAQLLLDNTNSDSVSTEFRIIRPKEKKSIWILGHAKIEFNSKGIRTKITGTIQDISERKKAEKIIRENQDFNESLLKTSPDIIYVHDLNKKRNMYNNNGAVKILGYSKQELIDFGDAFISQYMHPDDFETYTNKTLVQYGLMKDGEVIDQEYRISHKNGNYRWLHSRETIFKRENGKAVQIFGIANDITERKITEEKLKLSANRFERWKSSNFIGILQSNAKGDIVDANDTILDMLGYTKEELTQGKLDWTKLTPPEFLHLDAKAIKEAEKKGFWTPFEKEYFHKKGHRIPILIGGSLFKETQNEFIVFVINLTESKKIEKDLIESEEFLNLTGELAKVGGWEFNLISQKIKWSKETKNIHEVPQDYVPNLETAINFYHPDDRNMVKIFLTDAIENGKLFSYEARLNTAKGNQKFVKATGQPIFTDGKCVRLHGAFQDISERKKVDEELENYRKQLETENVLLKKEFSLAFSYEDIVYASDEISNVLTQVEQVATTDATVLILGETGTGKELIAKAIHNTSKRKNNSLIRVNCGAIPAELIESELFGHVKGSFTGAINNRIGKFELADGGTIFLDEIGELPLALQPKLLRAIQEGEIEPIGSSELRKLDVRIIAATNKNLKKEAHEKRFREDLYFRLNVFPIDVPPLRERIDDISVLIDFFVNKYTKKHNKNIKYISDLTIQQMKSYPWPGNVRELENLIERAVIISNEEVLIMQDFDNSSKNKTSLKNKNKTLNEVQRDHIIKTLNETNWKIDGNKGAAELLDIKPSTLRDRMKKLNIKRQ